MLKALWQAWKVIAEKIGTFQAKIILGLIYFVIVGPVALVRRLAADPLGLRREHVSTYWKSRPIGKTSLEAARRQ